MNLVLGGAVEYFGLEDVSAEIIAEDLPRRHLGLATVPGKHIVACYKKPEPVV